MKRTLIVLLLCITICFALPFALTAKAADGIPGYIGTEGLTYRLYLSVNGRPYCGYVSGYSGSEKNIVVPSQYNGYTIIGIDSSAFRDKTKISILQIILTKSKTTKLLEYLFTVACMPIR